MNKVPFFSVVIPTYNRSFYLIECLESVLAQTFEDFEVIIVDDGSNDDTGDLVKPYLSEKVHYIFQENKGVGCARNQGIKTSRGKYVAFLDSDNIWLTNHLQKYYEIIMERGIENVPVLHCNYRCFDEHGNLLPSDGEPLNGWVIKDLMRGTKVCINSIVVRRDALERVQFDEDRRMGVSADWEFVIRLSARYPLTYHPQISVLMRKHEEQMMADLGAISKSKMITLERIFANEELLPLIKPYRGLAYAHGCLVIGIINYEKGNMAEARSCIKKAMEHYPQIIFSPKALGLFAKTLLGRTLSKKGRELKRVIRSYFLKRINDSKKPHKGSLHLK